jgi:hypothetical protein
MQVMLSAFAVLIRLAMQEMLSTFAMQGMISIFAVGRLVMQVLLSAFAMQVLLSTFVGLALTRRPWDFWQSEVWTGDARNAIDFCSPKTGDGCK